MPVQVSYPGVYIEELPSGVRTITGVATSVTAFVGRAAQGLIDAPTMIFSFGDYERQFGGLSPAYPMSYAVQDFFMNGGSQALIVRVYKEPSSAATNHGVASAALVAPADNGGTAATTAPLNLLASSPGIWGNNLYAMVDTDGISDQVAALYAQYGVTKADLFNLTVYYAAPGKNVAVERFINLSVLKEAGPGRADRVLNQQSQYVRLSPDDIVEAAPDGWDTFLTGWNTFYTTNKKTRTDRLLPLLPRTAGGADSDSLTTDAHGETIIGSEDSKTGIYSLDRTDIFNLLCIPPDTLDPNTPWNLPAEVYTAAMEYCSRRRAMFIVDPPDEWSDTLKSGQSITNISLDVLGNFGEEARNGAVYFPRVMKPDPTLNGQLGVFPACGIVAGVYARTDVSRGVWKAPAGIDASLNGVSGVEYKLTDDENGILNPLGINCLRSFPVIGSVVWGARTMRGADQLADDYKYVSVRRLTLYIEESLYRGTQWAVFEPNAEPLWSQLRLNINTFMSDLSRQGAFYSYYVQCDKSTTTQSDIDRGIVNVVVAFAPVKPAEFVVLKIQQLAGATQS